SADINPIGSLNKQDIRGFLRWAAIHLGYSSLADIEAAPPTAELEPIRSDYILTDEDDMGMTYEELSAYGRLRKIFRCGPLSMFQNLCSTWGARLTPSQVAEKVKHFFKFYAITRHNMTTLTPSYHAGSYSPDDNRFDLRQFLYNTSWPYQFRKIDELVHELDVKDVQDSGNHEALAAASNGVGGVGVVASNGVNGMKVAASNGVSGKKVAASNGVISWMGISA
ncbi:glutamine-dependent NAD(+) synthetase-like, partial [Trifolium medium]|nr:glutamine-dependent NAD(+) synthetase-like [Trifolium medium]